MSERKLHENEAIGHTERYRMSVPGGWIYYRKRFDGAVIDGSEVFVPKPEEVLLKEVKIKGIENLYAEENFEPEMVEEKEDEIEQKSPAPGIAQILMDGMRDYFMSKIDEMHGIKEEDGAQIISCPMCNGEGLILHKKVKRRCGLCDGVGRLKVYPDRR